MFQIKLSKLAIFSHLCVLMKKYFSIVLSLIVSIAAFAQETSGKWNGNFSFLAGTFSYSLGEFKAAAGYSAPVVKLKLDADLSYYSKITENTGISFSDVKDLSFISNYKVDYGSTSSSRWDAKLGCVLDWAPDSRNSFIFFLRSSFDHDSPVKTNMTADGRTDVDTDAEIKYSYTTETIKNIKSVSSAGINFVHRFEKSGRELSAHLDGKMEYIDKNSEWMVGDIKGDTDNLTKHYRVTPEQYDGDFSARAAYSDKDFLGVSGLDIGLSLKALLKTNSDHQEAATMIGNQWVDSTSFRENFNFRRLTLNSRLRVEYSAGPWKFRLAYIPEFSIYRLDSDSQRGEATADSWAHLYDCTIALAPWKGGEFTLSGVSSIARPSYIQTCRFLRTGNYMDEFYIGNPYLIPASTYNTTLGYSHTVGIFTARLEGGYKHESDKIEQVLQNWEFEGASYRIYTWINGGKAQTVNARLFLEWRVKAFKAVLTGKYNYFIGTSNEGNVKRNSDYSIDGEASYKVATWTFLLKGRYQSKIIRSYQSITEIVGCDVRIDKDFKHFGVFADCRDLFDKPVEITTLTKDQTSGRVERAINNKRIFLLGVKYKF